MARFHFDPSVGDAAVKAIKEETGRDVAIIILAYPLTDDGGLDSPGVTTNMSTREDMADALDQTATWFRKNLATTGLKDRDGKIVDGDPQTLQ